MVRYRSRRPSEAELREKLRGLANERRRFGYRRLFVLLRREGEPSGVNRIHRLYREEGLSVRKWKARRRAVGARAPILVEAKANARWSLDFVRFLLRLGSNLKGPDVVSLGLTMLEGRRCPCDQILREAAADDLEADRHPIAGDPGAD